MADHTMTGATAVRVGYVPSGFGLSLAIAGSGDGGSVAGDAFDGRGANGVLNVGDGCVTLEIPAGVGMPAVLTWDPAEVDWDSMVA